MPKIDYGSVFFQTYAQNIEPLEIKWFSKMGVGKLLVGLWSLYSLFIVMIYCSLIRAALISPPREPPINNIRDVFERGQPIHILHPRIPLLDANGKFYSSIHAQPYEKECFDTAKDISGFCTEDMRRLREVVDTA